MSVKISSLEIENVKRVKAVRLEPTIDRALDALEREAQRHENAADIPFIGMEDCQREVERVIVLGASKRNCATEG